MILVNWLKSPAQDVAHAYLPGHYFSLCGRAALPADGGLFGADNELCERCAENWRLYGENDGFRRRPVDGTGVSSAGGGSIPAPPLQRRTW